MGWWFLRKQADFPLTRLIYDPFVARCRQGQWLRCFATERTGGVLACPVKMRLAAKRRRRGTDGAAAARLVNNAVQKAPESFMAHRVGELAIVVALSVASLLLSSTATAEDCRADRAWFENPTAPSQ